VIFFRMVDSKRLDRRLGRFLGKLVGMVVGLGLLGVLEVHLVQLVPNHLVVLVVLVVH
jgi:tetrahydromethanopterin S-methyltransferase subunit G